MLQGEIEGELERVLEGGLVGGWVLERGWCIYILILKGGDRG